MATWITHLRLAENLLGTLDGLDAHSFALGNIAPDSGVPDEKWENFTPPKEVSHFIVPAENDAWRIVDLVFYRRYLVPAPWPGDCSRRFSFLLGYFLHLVTDNLWSRWIARPTVEHFKAEFEADKRFIWTVKHDWYGLDIAYLQDHPGSLFYRVFLDCEYMSDYELDFMPEEGLCRQLDHVKTFYQDRERVDWAARRPDVYLTCLEMDRFAEDATRYLERTCRLLFEEEIDTSGYETIMELLPASR
jgi:hypothetical protein